MTIRTGRGPSALGAGAAALLLAACAGPSLTDQARFQARVGIETHPVAIIAVDGAPVTGGGGSTAMAPGLRKVTVQMPGAAGFKPGDTKTIDLEVKACTQYWLVATRDARVAPDYAVKVDHEKRDHRCERTAG